MLIETKYDHGNLVWTMVNDKCLELFVESIGLDLFDSTMQQTTSKCIYYKLRSIDNQTSGVIRREQDLYVTKLDLLNSL